MAAAVYLITVECGDYHKSPVTFRAYKDQGRADALMRRLDRYYKRKPDPWPDNATEEESDRLYQELMTWQKEHPLGDACAFADRDEIKIQVMPLC